MLKTIEAKAALAFRALSPKRREAIKRVLGAAGHRTGFLDEWRARQLGQGPKRPAEVIGFAASLLPALGRSSFSGMRVMEYGSGYLLAEPLAYSLLGAEHVSAVDYTPLLRQRAFRSFAANFAHEVGKDPAAAALGGQHLATWRQRLEAALATGRVDWYRDLGIDYHAPCDLLAAGARPGAFDVIVSRSTLEHVPPGAAAHIVEKLASLIRPGGLMYHAIHLEDHRDISGAPFAFLSRTDDYRASDFDVRGNRLRASDWRAIFAAISGFTWAEVAMPTAAHHLPVDLDPKFASYDADDLTIGHYVISGRKT